MSETRIVSWASSAGLLAGMLVGPVLLAQGPREFVTATLLPTVGSLPAVSGAAVAPLPGGGALLVGGTSASGPQHGTYTLAGTTWAIQYPPFTPATRTGGALVLDSARANNVLFGGKNPLGAPLGDTWTWASGAWSLMSVPGGPAPRFDHAMAFEPGVGRVLLFGGEGVGGAVLGDLWSWNGSNWSQLSPAMDPPARAGSGMAWDALRSRMVLFGGRSGPAKLDDLWEWDGASWGQVAQQAWWPVARDGHAMVYDPRSERVLVHGGSAAGGCMGDLWSWSGAGWVEHVSGQAMPSARAGHTIHSDDGAKEVRLHAGGCGANFSDELWSLELPVYPRWASYGQGCAGFAGVPQLAVRAGSEARIGGTLVFDLTNVPTTPFNLAFGVFDFQRDTFNGWPIPVHLSYAGLAGCHVWTGAFWSQLLPPMGVGVGTSMSVPLPNWPVLLGMHLYAQALVYDSSNGRWASLSNGVDARIGTPLLQGPIAQFTATPAIGIAPLVVQFTDASANSPSFWQWDFDGDGVVDSTVQNPVHTYAAPGVYSVRLVAGNIAGVDQAFQQGLIHVGGVNPALNMVAIQPGLFYMGSPEPLNVAPYFNQDYSQPVHAVTISSPFWVGKYEVTQAEYQALMGSNPSRFQGANRPVEQVSWYQAVAYCDALTAQEAAAGRLPLSYEYRLPTEAEWEYCCRAGTATEFSFGGNLSCGQANHYSGGFCVPYVPGGGQTSIVGNYAANAWGLHDMHGNVWEWCLDNWDGSANYPAGPVSDPYVTSGLGRVVRGGAWNVFSSSCRSAARPLNNPGDISNSGGFRVVCAPVR